MCYLVAYFPRNFRVFQMFVTCKSLKIRDYREKKTTKRLFYPEITLARISRRSEDRRTLRGIFVGIRGGILIRSN